jgi:hypothetical protein
MAGTGVFPVYDIEFKISTAGRTTPTYAVIADMETFGLSFDNGVEEWNPMDQEGWRRALMTAKGITISLNGKRNEGDAGNDYVAGMAFKNGRDAQSSCQVTMPDGSGFTMDCIVNVTNLGGGDAVNVAPLEFELISDGKPTLIPATP